MFHELIHSILWNQYICVHAFVLTLKWKVQNQSNENQSRKQSYHYLSIENYSLSLHLKLQNNGQKKIESTVYNDL